MHILPRKLSTLVATLALVLGTSFVSAPKAGALSGFYGTWNGINVYCELSVCDDDGCYYDCYRCNCYLI